MGKKTEKTSRKSIALLLLMSLLLTGLCFYSYFSEVEESIQISGTFNDYQETSRRVNKSRKTYYYIYLDGHRYSIPRIYISAFKKEEFLRDIKQGDSLTLWVHGNTAIDQISRSQKNYIDRQLMQEHMEENNMTGLILGCFFLACSGYLAFSYVKQKSS